MANEKRLIDVEQAKRATYEEIFWSESEQAVVRNFLAKLPKADAVEVVHARWIEKVDMVESYLADCTEVFYECSVCESANIGESPYCPNCGADMRGEKDD